MKEVYIVDRFYKGNENLVFLRASYIKETFNKSRVEVKIIDIYLNSINDPTIENTTLYVRKDCIYYKLSDAMRKVISKIFFEDTSE